MPQLTTTHIKNIWKIIVLPFEKIWLGINEIRLKTSWDNPQSAKDLNNFAVLALIEAENAEELSIGAFYLDRALEALNKGVELYNDSLCAAHFDLILAMTGDLTQATHITLPNVHHK